MAVAVFTLLPGSHKKNEGMHSLEKLYACSILAFENNHLNNELVNYSVLENLIQLCDFASEKINGVVLSASKSAFLTT